MSYDGYYSNIALPWVDTENERRFKKILRVSLLLFVIVGIVIPYLPVPEINQKKLEDVSPRLARLIIEKQKKPPPPVAKAKKKKPVKKKAKKKPKPDPRKKAERSGLLAMQDTLADLRESFDLASLKYNRPVKTSTKARRTKQTTSQVIAIKANQSSGGINTRSLTRVTGGNRLSSRQTTAVSSNLNQGKKVKRRVRASSNSRGEEEIELVFQKNKGRIFSIYNRALRKDPSLQGKVVLELTIAPSGKVVRCQIISSDLNDKILERKLIARIKLFRFAAKDVATVTVTYPIEFLPT